MHSTTCYDTMKRLCQLLIFSAKLQDKNMQNRFIGFHLKQRVLYFICTCNAVTRNLIILQYSKYGRDDNYR